jgi:hypothetical protein
MAAKHVFAAENKNLQQGAGAISSCGRVVKASDSKSDGISRVGSSPTNCDISFAVFAQQKCIFVVMQMENALGVLCAIVYFHSILKGFAGEKHVSSIHTPD